MAKDSNSKLLPLVPVVYEYNNTRKSSYHLLTDPNDTGSVK